MSQSKRTPWEQLLNFENLNCACEAESASHTAACDIVCSSTNVPHAASIHQGIAFVSHHHGIPVASTMSEYPGSLSEKK
jgi:hypothetical protein